MARLTDFHRQQVVVVVVVNAGAVVGAGISTDVTDVTVPS
jgi:hypothetical protein